MRARTLLVGAALAATAVMGVVTPAAADPPLPFSKVAWNLCGGLDLVSTSSIQQIDDLCDSV
ncbi:hypothetical protein [Nocardiopsis chromatogenes]|uniref:hypothetical protein n=1 Tax=Nocardiopsis chromatogenes TaxID=280239 RepID=UPI00034AC66D|nr:hypothetical protein [Nocardiopsis chromatogenes]